MNVIALDEYKYDSQTSACASCGLKLSDDTTSRYAQAGMEVPFGICGENLSSNVKNPRSLAEMSSVPTAGWTPACN